MKKIAVFLGDFFWSSVPYDGYRLLKQLQKNLDVQVDFLMFEKDIRLNKKFSGKEKFIFDTNIFKSESNLITLKSWNDLYTISKDYHLIITSTHIAPKTRYPSDIRSKKKCLFAAWDIGGLDIMTNAIHFADLYFVKGRNWKKWLCDKGLKDENIFITGSPHYDDYIIQSYDEKKRIDFFKKYSLNKDLKTLLICPSNPGSHKEHFEQNITQLQKLVNLSKKLDLNLLLKTYPHDYVFYENETPLSGIYRRIYNDKPHYQFLNSIFPELTVVESQDHHSAIMFSDIMFNMSGSHVAWETHFSKCKSYSTNYKDKKYYGQVSYLKDVKLPDEIYNIHVDNITDFDLSCKEILKDNDYIIRTDSVSNITQTVRDFLKI